MTSAIDFEIEAQVNRMIEVINGLRYDDDYEPVDKGETSIVVDKIVCERFNEVKWAIAERIGFDVCFLTELDDFKVGYEVTRHEDERVDMIVFGVDGDCRAEISYYVADGPTELHW